MRRYTPPPQIVLELGACVTQENVLPPEGAIADLLARDVQQTRAREQKLAYAGADDEDETDDAQEDLDLDEDVWLGEEDESEHTGFVRVEDFSIRIETCGEVAARINCSYLTTSGRELSSVTPLNVMLERNGTIREWVPESPDDVPMDNAFDAIESAVGAWSARAESMAIDDAEYPIEDSIEYALRLALGVVASIKCILRQRYNATI